MIFFLYPARDIREIVLQGWGSRPGYKFIILLRIGPVWAPFFIGFNRFGPLLLIKGPIWCKMISQERLLFLVFKLS